MKKFKLFSIAALCVAALSVFMVACQKDETTLATTVSPQNITLKGVTVVDGKLKFNTQEDFNEAIKTLHANKKKLENVENQFNGFVSARKAFAEITEESLIKSNGSIEPYKHVAAIVDVNGDKHLDPVVDAKYLAILANGEGLIQIGNTIYKFTRNYVYEFDAALMPQYESSKNNIELMQGTKKHPITRSNDVKDDRWDRAQCDKFYDNNGRKVSTEIENNSYFLYYEAKGRVINRKKGAFGLWYRKYTDGITLNGTFTVTEAFIPNTSNTFTQSFSDSSSWQAELHEAVGAGITGVILSVSGTATGNADPEDPSGQSWLGCTVTKQ